VTLYDFDSDRERILWRAPGDRTVDVRDLSFSEDGSKVVIYAALTSPSERSTDHVWVINVSSSQAEAHRQTANSGDNHFGAAQLSPDNRYLYLASSEYRNYRYSIQCVDITTGDLIWETAAERDQGLTTLALSPDGRLLASGSGYEDPTIRVWDATNGRLLVRLDGHTAWVAKLAFSKDGQRLVSAASDQTIRLWDTNAWAEVRVLRGHADELHAVAISQAAQLVASGSKDGELMLWKEDGKQSGHYYRILPESIARYPALILDGSRVLFLASDQPGLVLDVKDESPMTPLPQFGFPATLLDHATPTTFFHWNGTDQILIHELRGTEWIKRQAIALSSSAPPGPFTYNSKHQLLAWTEPPPSTSIYMVSLAAPDRRIELTSDLPGASSLLFSNDGQYLLAERGHRSLRICMVATGRIVLSLNEPGVDAIFSGDGQQLVVVAGRGGVANAPASHEIRFYDLNHPDKLPRRFPGRHFASALALSPDRQILASPTGGGQVHLFDAAKGELIESLHGHLNAIFGIDFSADGRRLITSSGGREAVKLWDMSTRQELLTLNGAGSTIRTAKWTTDGNAILAGPPWQAWLAPSWKEIAAAEAIER
jgi:WD40 repeat protein